MTANWFQLPQYGIRFRTLAKAVNNFRFHKNVGIIDHRRTCERRSLLKMISVLGVLHKIWALLQRILYFCHDVGETILLQILTKSAASALHFVHPRAEIQTEYPRNANESHCGYINLLSCCKFLIILPCLCTSVGKHRVSLLIRAFSCNLWLTFTLETTICLLHFKLSDPHHMQLHWWVARKGTVKLIIIWCEMKADAYCYPKRKEK